VRKDIDRIAAMWRALRVQHGAAGPFPVQPLRLADGYDVPGEWRFGTTTPELAASVRA
jgi:hypothetical protein